MGQGQLRFVIYIKFVELEYIVLHAKFHDHRTGQVVSEEKTFEHCGWMDDDDRGRINGYTISSPCEPDSSGELKKSMEISTHFVAVCEVTVSTVLVHNLIP